MLFTETKLRVRYAETDRMGYAYYGNYATYFEVARVETLRSVGVSYKSLEDEGILLPVLEYNIRYIKPAHYDDELVIKTCIPELPSARIRFTYHTYRNDELLNEAWTDLVFVSRNSSKPIRCPQQILDELQKYF